MQATVNWDIAVLTFLALAGLRGVWRGFFRELGSLIGCAAGVLVGWSYGAPLADQLRGGTTGAASEFDAALVFLVVFVGLWMAGGLLGWAVERVFRWAAWSWISGVAGFAVGLVKGAAIAGVCLLFVELFVPQAAEQVESAPVTRWLTHVAGAAASWVVQQKGAPA
jgi:membrane protein required for colicin V production